MIEKDIGGVTCHGIHRYARSNNKYMKKIIIQTLKKLLVNGFEWVEELYQFNKYFIKSYNENSNKE